MSNFDTNANVTNFARSLGNGANALDYMAQAFVHVSANGNDGTQIGRLIDRAKAKGDDSAARAVIFFVGQVWKGATVKSAKGKPTSVKLKTAIYNADAMAVVEQAVSDGLSIRSTKLKEIFKPKVQDASEDPDTQTDNVPLQITDQREKADAQVPTVTTPASDIEPETKTVEAEAEVETIRLTAEDLFLIALDLDTEELAKLAGLLNAHLSLSQDNQDVAAAA